jgi:hypothetical protein
MQRQSVYKCVFEHTYERHNVYLQFTNVYLSIRRHVVAEYRYHPREKEVSLSSHTSVPPTPIVRVLGGLIVSRQRTFLSWGLSNVGT